MMSEEEVKKKIDEQRILARTQAFCEAWLTRSLKYSEQDYKEGLIPPEQHNAGVLIWRQFMGIDGQKPPEEKKAGE
jgi:hypothetical protein